MLYNCIFNYTGLHLPVILYLQVVKSHLSDYSFIHLTEQVVIRQTDVLLHNQMDLKIILLKEAK